MYVMIKLLVNAITYCFLCARYNNKHFTNVGSFHPHDNPFSIIILILQMRTLRLSSQRFSKCLRRPSDQITSLSYLILCILYQYTSTVWTICSTHLALQDTNSCLFLLECYCCK